MVAWPSAFLICLAFSLDTLVQRGSADFDFDLSDALKETSSVKQRWDHVTTTTKRPGTTRAPSKPAGDDFDLADALGDRDDGRRKPSAGGGEKWDHVTTTTKRPGTTRAPSKPAVDDFDLADALDDRNDRDDGRRKPSAGGGGFSDKDLEDVLGGGDYKPDKGRGDGRYGNNDDSEAGEFESQDFCWKPQGDIVLAHSPHRVGLPDLPLNVSAKERNVTRDWHHCRCGQCPGHGLDWRCHQLHLLPAEEVLLPHPACSRRSRGSQCRLREGREPGSCCV